MSLAAIMFVDDTDLLFASKHPEESAENFLRQVQDRLTDWANTVLVTGGNINLRKVVARLGCPSLAEKACACGRQKDSFPKAT